MSKKWETAEIHREIHSKKGSAALAWSSGNAGIARDEGPIWADDANKRMFPYFSVSLAIRRFSNVLKESRNQTGTSCQEFKLTCNLFLLRGVWPSLNKHYGKRSKSYLKHSPENLRQWQLIHEKKNELCGIWRNIFDTLKMLPFLDTFSDWDLN